MSSSKHRRVTDSDSDEAELEVNGNASPAKSSDDGRGQRRRSTQRQSTSARRSSQQDDDNDDDGVGEDDDDDDDDEDDEAEQISTAEQAVAYLRTAPPSKANYAAPMTSLTPRDVADRREREQNDKEQRRAAVRADPQAAKEWSKLLQKSKARQLVRVARSVDRAIEVLQQQAQRTGLQPSHLLTVIDAATSGKHNDTRASRLLHVCLPSNAGIPERCLVVVVGRLTARMMSPVIQALALKWCVCAHPYLSSTDTVHGLYGMLMHYLDFDTLRPSVCALLNLLTRRRDAQPFRVRRLLDLNRKAGGDHSLLALLRVYQLYQPDLISISLSGVQLQRATFQAPDSVLARLMAHTHSIAENFANPRGDVPLFSGASGGAGSLAILSRSALHYTPVALSSSRHTSDSTTLAITPAFSSSLSSSRALAPPKKRLRLDPIAPVLHTSHIAAGSVKGLTVLGMRDIGARFTVRHTATLEQLNSLSELGHNIDRVEMPNQIAAVLESPILRHALSCVGDPVLIRRLGYYLEQLLADEFGARDANTAMAANTASTGAELERNATARNQAALNERLAIQRDATSTARLMDQTRHPDLAREFELPGLKSSATVAQPSFTFDGGHDLNVRDRAIYNRRSRLLQTLVDLNDFFLESDQVVLTFLTKYLRVWNGIDHRAEILALVSRISPLMYEELYGQFLFPLQHIFETSSPQGKAEILLAYRHLLHRMCSVDWRKFFLSPSAPGEPEHEFIFNSHTLSRKVNYFRTIQEFGLHVQRLSLVALELDADHIVVQHAVLSFFELGESLLRDYNLPFYIHPPHSILARLFYSTQMMVVSRVCDLLQRIGDTYTKIKKIEQWGMVDRATSDTMTLHNATLLEIVNSVWRDKPMRQTDSQVPLFTANVEPLAIRICQGMDNGIREPLVAAPMSDALNLFNHFAFVSTTRQFLVKHASTLKIGNNNNEQPLVPATMGRLAPQRSLFLFELEQANIAPGLMRLLCSAFQSLQSKISGHLKEHPEFVEEVTDEQNRQD
ncbi:hypothetical protein CAOG_06267 [Capsaspora owczarzaki ATCC 30864]|uniref:Centromere protein I n=1 Tax=Capsaspora owczarzaki (strain ATCC 30864) TaxID=595528 RepID=A0A0D2X4D4_CAPO3|nr:hypothetical protein CAOG_06267 [Capsaspora owczarzaki ATCC 30864]KJE95864.1 hypothetical protein CAOG_006267 [Capsaspora owczarzaki ATCC 30864]|eukprot:XP_004345016.2 hypothetical protein CAOG_06267 [Capsaspora owczarzaki ATCC 30864]